MSIIETFFGDYFILRQRVPFLIYFLYMKYGELENPIIDRIIITILTFTGLISTYTIFGFIFKIPFFELMPFTWTYYGLIHWCIFFFIFYQLAIRKGMNSLKSFTLAILATVGCGWLYEVPYFHPASMFISRYALFYVNGQIVYLLLLGYELMKAGFKPNRWVWSTLILFLVFSTCLFIDKPGFWHTVEDILGSTENLMWVYRTPASLFLLSLLSGIRKQNGGNVRHSSGDDEKCMMKCQHS